MEQTAESLCDVRLGSEGTLSSRIQNSWLNFGENEPVNASRISCLLAVLKLAYGTAPSLFGDPTDNIMAAKEKLNASLKYAWKDLRHASSQIMDGISQEVWQKPLSDVTITESQFSSLISSELMCASFWCLSTCQPFAKPLWRGSVKTDPEGIWRTVTEPNTPPEIIEASRGLYPSLNPTSFNFEASPWMNWEEEINSLFCVSDIDEMELATPTASLLVIGVHFTVRDVTRSNRLKLEHFGAFELQHFGMEKRYDECSWRKREENQYTALAIVKFRQTPDGLDSIRVFDRYQKPKVPVSQAAYATPEWEVSQFNNGDSFFVLYERHIYESYSIDQGRKPYNEEEWEQFAAFYDQ
ncbi:hypothetical protein NLG97_g6956 [Lecanicillium saksenae]|uniref:Uncharacterized protein n=1 Tax=Lecanicillium saksenae TaxID=468837 RepID=A0ACC1QPC1_9HYPO|nr:hypothetical protein NLG97_g6956 [Lecanicillium saksenae]